MICRSGIATPLLLLALLLCQPASADTWQDVSHHYADNDGVKIHYVSQGEGPVVLFVHGFPDFWYSWQHQMDALKENYRTVAMDLRGYNKSDKPAGKENYQMQFLLADVAAVIKDLGVPSVNLVGHDWGGAISWRFAMANPSMVENLVILNLTHPKGYAAVLANPTPAQIQNTAYARNFAKDGSHKMLKVDFFIPMVAGDDETSRARYREGLGNSSLESMVAYYQANFTGDNIGNSDGLTDLEMPVLQFHGLKDTAVDKDGLSNTWNWVKGDYTLVTVPDASHWVQHDAADLVSTTLKFWLDQRN